MQQGRKDSQSPESHYETSVSNSTKTHTPNSNDISMESPIDLQNVDNRGYLDWSSKGMNTLPRQKCAEICGHGKPIIRLAIPMNSLRSISCSNLPLEQCTEVDASCNYFSQLHCFHPLIQTLEYLNLSDNRINSLDTINNFTNLINLDLSHNRIEKFPILDQLTKLTSLNLSSNHLKLIPNLSRLNSLSQLSLNGNSIRALAGILTLLPAQNLHVLDIGGNLISDLTEMNYLCGFKKLISLTVLGNVCTKSDNRNFSYRPFVFSCILGDLKILDGSCFSEQEIIKGEWLHAQGRARSFRPQKSDHIRLCNYLIDECPLVSAEIQLVKDEKFKKVIQKRREYRNDLLEMETSQSENLLSEGKSIASTTSTKLQNDGYDKEKIRATPTATICTTPKSAGRKPLASRFNIQSTTRTPILAKRPIIRTPISTVVNAKQMESKIGNLQDGNNTVSTSASASSPSSHHSSNTIIISKNGNNKDAPNVGEGAELYPIGSPFPITSLPIPMASPFTKIYQKNYSNHQKHLDSSKISPIYSNSNTSRDALLNLTMEQEEINKKKKTRGCFRSVLGRKLHRFSGITHPSSASSDSIRLLLMHRKIDQLAKQNSMLNSINEDHVKIFQQLTQKLQKLEALINQQEIQNNELIKLLVPTPSNLSFKRQEDNKVLISWENITPLNDSIDFYELVLNEKPAREVKARSKRLLITDINPGEEMKVSLQAFISRLNHGFRSAKGEIIIPATLPIGIEVKLMEEEVKENLNKQPIKEHG